MTRTAVAEIVGVQVGVATAHRTRSGREYRTAFWKRPLDGPARLNPDGLEGDQQADLVHHGGADKAMLAYSVVHYPRWCVELYEPLLTNGAFGENCTVACIDEHSVSIGDTWRFGTAEVQVSQPRQPCWKLNERWGRSDLVSLMEATGHTGWYHRVITPGQLGPGDDIELLDRPHPAWSIAAANAAMRHRRQDPDRAHRLAELPELSTRWSDTLMAADRDERPRREGPR